MLHYRDKRVKGLFKLKTFSFLLFCFTYCFLVHSACTGAEETPQGTDNPETIKGLRRESSSKSVSFDSHSSDSSHSTTSSNQYISSGNPSPILKKSTRGSITSQNSENDPTAAPHKKKRGILTRSLSSCKIKEKYVKDDKKSPVTSQVKEETLTLRELLTESTTALHETEEKRERDTKKEMVEELLSSFVDERAIFAALIDLEGAAFIKLEGTYPPTLIISLKELILEKFQGRVENLRLVLADYDAKIKLIPTSVFPLIEIKSSNLATYSELIYPLELEKTNNFLWKISDVKQLASALYIRDFATFHDIDPGDLLLDSIKKDNTSKKAIMTLTKNHNATADLWAFQILAEQEEERRKTLITNITFLGRFLYMTHNYHGASQVNACFAKRSVSRLWEINPALDPLRLDSNWSTVKGGLTPRGNYKSYREQLKQSQNDLAYLPDFAVIMHDLENSFGIFNEKPDQGLAALAISLEPLLKLKTLSSSHYLPSLIEKEAENPFLKLICGLSEINEDVLEELSLSTTNS